jgi:hypothetical protein
VEVSVGREGSTSSQERWLLFTFIFFILSMNLLSILTAVFHLWLNLSLHSLSTPSFLLCFHFILSLLCFPPSSLPSHSLFSIFLLPSYSLLSSHFLLPHFASSYSPLCVVTGQTSGIRAKQHGAQHRHNRETEGDNTAEDITRAGSYTAHPTHTHTHTALIILHRIRELNPICHSTNLPSLSHLLLSLSLFFFLSLSPFSLALLSLSLIFFSLFSVSHSSFLFLFLHCIPGGERGRARQR